jgi:Carboxypeptidase regulatory-like domain
MPANKPNNVLVVRTLAYPTTIEGTGPDDPGVRPLAGVTVTLRPPGTEETAKAKSARSAKQTGAPGSKAAAQAGTAQSATPAAPPATATLLPLEGTTNSEGQVRFEDIGEGDYTIDVRQPVGFKEPTRMFVGKQRKDLSDKIRMPEGGEVVINIVMAPEPGVVEGTVEVLDSAGNPLAGVDIEELRIEARNRGRLVDSDVTGPTGHSGSYARSGAFSLEIDEPGLIEIIAQPSFDSGSRTFVPKTGNASLFRSLEPGETVTVTIQYEPAKAEIVVGAQLVDSGTGQLKQQVLGGVTFKLFKLGDDQPLSKLTTQPHTKSTFRELPAGTYRVVAVLPSVDSGQRLQLAYPSTGEILLRLDEGQRVDLSEAFRFEPARGSVTGLVVLDHDGTPVSGVSVVLSSYQQPSVIRTATTDANGVYEIHDLPAGTYRIGLQEHVVTAFGRRWERKPTPGSVDGGQPVGVADRGTTPGPDLRLVEEEHLIKGTVLGPDDRAAPHVIVQIFDGTDPTSRPIGQVLTEEDGTYEFRAPTAGTYFLRVDEQFTAVTVQSTVVAPTLRTLPPPPPPPSPQDNDFPFLTEEIDVGGGGAPARPPGGTGSVGQIVEREIREVLGWRPRTSDPKSFLAALEQAFTVTEVAGHTEAKWNPRSYSVEIQADLGAITGAQASLYTRAKGTLEQVLPLLDGLEPLRVDVDPENVSAIRAIVRSHLTELVAELGVEGGPRVQRVDQLFEFLVGEYERLTKPRLPKLGSLRDPDKVGGALRILRDRLGIDRDRINTVEEEQNFTNFLVVLDLVVSLAESWESQRDFFIRGSAVEPFLGTQLILLSRDLEVIAESVHEVEFAMNSVFLGPAERQTLELKFPSRSSGGTSGGQTSPILGAPPIFVSELLEWVERFATEEGRRLIDEGGRQGVVAFLPTIDLLSELVKAALVTSEGGKQDPTRMPAAYARRRVQRAIRELADQLKNAADRARNIKAPSEDDD